MDRLPADPLALIGYIAGLFGLIAVVSAAVIVMRSTAIRENVKAQADLITTLKDKVDILEAADKDNKQRISELEKELKTFKDLPLSAMVEAQISNGKKLDEILEIIKEK